MSFCSKVAVLCITLGIFVAPSRAVEGQYENCIFLGNSRLQASWTVRREDSAIDIQLCGCDGEGTSGVETPNEYMGFGLSGSPSTTLMLGADPTIAWVDNDMGPQAQDYFLSAYSQCRPGMSGACPDTMDTSGQCTDDVFNVTGFRREGLQCVSFTRRFTTEDSRCDVAFNVTQDQYIVWAVGGLGETAFKHFRRAEPTDGPVNFGRSPSNQCQGGLICPNCPPFTETVMDVTGQNATFVATIGPTGNERGYMAIANQAGWGFSWFLNNTLIPRLVVERGYTYTFISEGGDDPSSPEYHPFYITDSRRGGRDTNSQALRESETVFAGFDEDGNPLGVGPYCALLEPVEASTILNTCGSQGDYYAALERSDVCPSTISTEGFTWTPGENTPNVVYYQCATHTNFGYQITVMPPLDDDAPKMVAYGVTTLLMVLLTFVL